MFCYRSTIVTLLFPVFKKIKNKNLVLIDTHMFASPLQVRGIETMATFDAVRGEFIINTPCESAQKFWIGGAAQVRALLLSPAPLLSTVLGPITGVDTWTHIPGPLKPSLCCFHLTPFAPPPPSLAFSCPPPARHPHGVLRPVAHRWQERGGACLCGSAARGGGGVLPGGAHRRLRTQNRTERGGQRKDLVGGGRSWCIELNSETQLSKLLNLVSPSLPFSPPSILLIFFVFFAFCFGTQTFLPCPHISVSVSVSV